MCKIKYFQFENHYTHRYRKFHLDIRVLKSPNLIVDGTEIQRNNNNVFILVMTDISSSKSEKSMSMYYLKKIMVVVEGMGEEK